MTSFGMLEGLKGIFCWLAASLIGKSVARMDWAYIAHLRCIGTIHIGIGDIGDQCA